MRYVTPCAEVDAGFRECMCRVLLSGTMLVARLTSDLNWSSVVRCEIRAVAAEHRTRNLAEGTRDVLSLTDA